MSADGVNMATDGSSSVGTGYNPCIATTTQSVSYEAAPTLNSADWQSSIVHGVEFNPFHEVVSSIACMHRRVGSPYSIVSMDWSVRACQ